MLEGLTGEVEKLAYRFHDGTPLSTLSYLDRVCSSLIVTIFFNAILLLFLILYMAIIVVRSFDMR